MLRATTEDLDVRDSAVATWERGIQTDGVDNSIFGRAGQVRLIWLSSRLGSSKDAQLETYEVALSDF